MRRINNEFITELLRGELEPLLKLVIENRDTLALEVRDGSINLYYKGGSLLKVTYHRRKGYEFSFDPRYCLNKEDTSAYDEIRVFDPFSVRTYLSNLPRLMYEMDTWMAVHPKAERCFQHQLLVSNPEIVDIEYQVGSRMRLDMLAVRDGKLLLIENKYGLGAISGRSGLAKHYSDMCEVWETQSLREELLDSVEHTTSAKFTLGLSERPVKREDIKGAEILFLLAGYNPNSKAALNEFSQMKPVLPARLLYMGTDESRISWNEAVSCFGMEV